VYFLDLMKKYRINYNANVKNSKSHFYRGKKLMKNYYLNDILSNFASIFNNLHKWIG